MTPEQSQFFQFPGHSAFYNLKLFPVPILPCPRKPAGLIHQPQASWGFISLESGLGRGRGQGSVRSRQTEDKFCRLLRFPQDTGFCPECGFPAAWRVLLGNKVIGQLAKSQKKDTNVDWETFYKGQISPQEGGQLLFVMQRKGPGRPSDCGSGWRVWLWGQVRLTKQKNCRIAPLSWWEERSLENRKQSLKAV